MEATPEKGMADLAVEYWRLLRMCERLLAEVIGPQAMAKHIAQLRYAQRQLSSILKANGFDVMVYEGMRYEVNLPVTIVNEEDARGDDPLLIEQTIEPTITAHGRILRMGRVRVRTAGGKGCT